MDREGITLETIYRDALEEIRLRRDSGLLSSKDYHVITSTHDPLELYTLLMTAESCKSGIFFPAAKTKTRNVVEPILLRFERFGSAIDMLAQSSPQVMGISAVGLLWGSLKFVFTVSGPKPHVGELAYISTLQLLHSLRSLVIYMPHSMRSLTC